MTDHATFTRTAAEMVAANDARVPEQRAPDSRPIEPAGTVIVIEGGGRFVSNGCVWLACDDGRPGMVFRPIASEEMNRRWAWWIVAQPASVGGE